jgi:signal transduction histidine kinase/CheY-like chemotaxis protein
LHRTPLNTITLSIRILLENLNELRDLCESKGQTLAKDPMELSRVSSLFTESFDLIDDLEENSSVAVTTLNDLINYDKIETNTFTIEEKDVNIWTVIEKTVGPLTLQAKEKNIALNLVTRVADEEENIDLNSLRVVGDSIKLGQVVRNLVSNALKFTPAHGKVEVSGTAHRLVIALTFPLVIACYEPIKIAVTTPRRRAGTFTSIHIQDPLPIGNIIITVTDSGPGLSSEQQLALFHQGVQFNPNQLQAGQGSGLGLWISKEIVSLHHGTILVTSDGLGCGSTFKVTLPVVLRENLPPVPPSNRLIPAFPPTALRVEGEGANPPMSPPNMEDRHGSHLLDISPSNIPLIKPESKPEPRERHVLVVDDAPSNRKLVCRLLRSKGFICHEAENGAECVEKVMSKEHPYELILMDYEMPVMNGPSAARQLRQNRCNLLIIGVTGNVLPEDKAFFLEHGADLVLTKPLDVSELLKEIDSHHRSPFSHV